MAEKIRVIQDDDFASVAKLFDNTKSVEELKWLFTNPENLSSYNAFVAIDNKDQIIGVIGYVVSYYIQDQLKIKGVFPMSWKIKSGYKGFAGVLLMKKALEMGDFAFTTGGTRTALTLFPIFKFKHINNGYKYYKVFNIWRFFRSTDEGLLSKSFKTLWLFPSIFKYIPKSSIYKDVNLIKYSKSDADIQEAFNDKGFHKQIDKNYIHWLQRCPIHECFTFVINKGDQPIGICVFYIRQAGSEKRGRIVYLSYLGVDKKLWNSVLYKIFAFFKRHKCNSISTLATTEDWIFGYSKGMSKFIKPRPIYIKDSKLALKEIDLQNWNIQYTEGDTAYLNI